MKWITLLIVNSSGGGGKITTFNSLENRFLKALKALIVEKVPTVGGRYPPRLGHQSLPPIVKTNRHLWPQRALREHFPVAPGANCYLLFELAADRNHRTTHRGGGGGVLPYVCILWVCAARETPIFSPKFPFRSISLSQMTKKSGPEHHHFTFIAVPESIIFKISFNNFNPFTASHGRLSPNAKRSAAPRVSGRPECQPDASWQFRRPAFSRSKRLKLVPEPRIFMLDRGARSGARADFSRCRGTYLPKLGVSRPTPPPPPSPVLRM